MAFAYSPKIVTDGLVLYLDAANPYSYVSGSTAWNDISRGGNNGTLVNGPTFSSANNGSIVFDGVDDYVDCGNNTPLQITNNLSVFGWVKGGSQDNKDIVTKYRTISDQRSWIFGTSLSSDGLGTNKLKVVLSSNGTFNSGFLKYYISDLVVFDNNWKYVGFVFQSNSLKLYVNGSEVSTTKIYDATVNTLYNSSASVWVGAMSNPANQYTGNVSTTQIYNRALSSDEVLQNYNATKGRFGLT